MSVQLFRIAKLNAKTLPSLFLPSLRALFKDSFIYISVESGFIALSMPFCCKSLERVTVGCTCVGNAIFCSFKPWMGKLL